MGKQQAAALNGELYGIKKQGRISIIMPVYNGVSWIGECIESIRQQTDTNWELLVLDDHSTDGPQSWCLNWRKRIPEFYRFCVRKTVYPQRATRDWKKRKENLSCLWMRTISWIRRCSLCFGRCWGRQKATLRSVITIDGTVNRAEFITGQRGC